MNYVLDTHVWIWSVDAPERMAPAIRDIVESGEHELLLSSISLWETLLLSERGRLGLGDDPASWIEFALREYPITEAPINHRIAMLSRRIELARQDPADRFLAATAIAHDATLLTHDQVLLAASAVPTLPLGS